MLVTVQICSFELWSEHLNPRGASRGYPDPPRLQLTGTCRTGRVEASRPPTTPGASGLEAPCARRRGSPRPSMASAGAAGAGTRALLNDMLLPRTPHALHPDGALKGPEPACEHRAAAEGQQRPKPESRARPRPGSLNFQREDNRGGHRPRARSRARVPPPLGSPVTCNAPA